MATCTQCGFNIVRTHRNLVLKIVDRAAYQCEHCKAAYHFRRSFVTIFHRYCECPQCGTQDLSRLSSVDAVDEMSRNPIRRILVVFGCTLYHCTYCRFQFRDWRKRAPDARLKKAAGAG